MGRQLSSVGGSSIPPRTRSPRICNRPERQASCGLVGKPPVLGKERRNKTVATCSFRINIDPRQKPPPNHSALETGPTTERVKVSALAELRQHRDVNSLRSALHELCGQFGRITRLDILTAMHEGTKQAICFMRMERPEQEQTLMKTLGGRPLRWRGGVCTGPQCPRDSGRRRPVVSVGRVEFLLDTAAILLLLAYCSAPAVLALRFSFQEKKPPQGCRPPFLGSIGSSSRPSTGSRSLLCARSQPCPSSKGFYLCPPPRTCKILHVKAISCTECELCWIHTIHS